MNNSIETLLPYSKKLNLLLVHDNRSVKFSFEDLLKKVFNTVYMVKDTNEALEYLSKYHINAILIDIEKKENDALDISRMLRKKELEMPIVLTTDNVDENFFDQLISIGIDQYITKPIDERVLLYAMKKIIKNIQSLDNMQRDSHYFKVLLEESIVSKSDIDGKIIYVNDNLCKISGYTREELLGKNHNIFRHPSNENSLYKDMWGTITKGKIWRSRVENLNKNGESFLADTIIIPLEDVKGEIFEYIAIRQDVTEYVKLMRKIHAEKLKKEEDRKINEAKEAFLVLFTHELKTPLNAIINFSKYMFTKISNSEELQPEKAKKLLKSITSNANDMLDNVENILAISKLQTNKLSYNKKLFSINKVLIQLLEQYDSLISAKNMEIEFLIDETTEVYSDEYRVKQIISNVLSNALKYGNKKILIKVEKLPAGIEINIDDDGKGIADKESVFNLYEQGNNSLIKRDTQGTGVGLYFVKLLCIDLGIGYKLEDSKKLGGTSFVLSFNNINNKKKG